MKSRWISDYAYIMKGHEQYYNTTYIIHLSHSKYTTRKQSVILAIQTFG